MLLKNKFGVDAHEGSANKRNWISQYGFFIPSEELVLAGFGWIKDSIRINHETGVISQVSLRETKECSIFDIKDRLTKNKGETK